MAIDKRAINERRAMLIAQAADSPEGRVALAQAMVEPIRRALEYQAVGRKLIMVDELPQGAYARYEKDVRSRAVRLSRRGGAPEFITEGEEILVPTFEIVVNPTVRISEVKARRFYIVDRAQIKAKEAIQKEEDTNIFTAINTAVPAANQVVSTGGALSLSALNQAFVAVESRDLTVGKVVCHAIRYGDIRSWGQTVFDQATQKEVLTTGLFGHIYTARMFVMAPAEYVGAMPVRQDISVIPADDPKRLRLGWVVYEEIGIVIINDYAIARVEVSVGS